MPSCKGPREPSRYCEAALVREGQSRFVVERKKIMALHVQDIDALPVCVDFDGVLRRYSKGWNYGDPSGNDPEELAVEHLRLLMGHRPVVILTARDPLQVAQWLAERGILSALYQAGPVWDRRDIVLVTRTKPNASAYIDDRAVHFTSWPQAFAVLRERGILPEGAGLSGGNAELCPTCPPNPPYPFLCACKDREDVKADAEEKISA